MKVKFSDDVVANHLRGVSGYDRNGGEILDPRPVEMPPNAIPKPQWMDEVQRLLGIQRQRELEQAGMGTFEEEDDFNIPDDPIDPQSPWEEGFDPLEVQRTTAEMENGLRQPPVIERRKPKAPESEPKAPESEPEVELKKGEKQ